MGEVAVCELGELEDLAGDDARTGGVVVDYGVGGQKWSIGEGEEVGGDVFHHGGSGFVG